MMRAIVLLAAAGFAVAPVKAQDPGAIRVLLTPELETTLASPMLGRVRNVNVSLGSGFDENKVLV
ncbi:MAG TPA: efflux transporter periplasmic adaptor subunit, partial [Burkholderiales bacterium]|nr:efflux transporter periplasmic adaptor subunit [Burkholderiales bacterium]